MATGNGAYVLHRLIESHIQGYQTIGYHPYWTLFPLFLPFLTRQLKAEIIHTAPDYGIFFHKKNIPLVVTIHNYVLDRFMRTYSSLAQTMHYTTDLKWFTKRALDKAHTITAVSRFAADIVKKELKIKQPIKIIYNGVDESLFRPVMEKKKKKRVNVFFSGNLIQRKGYMWLPRIAEKLNPNICLYYTQGLRTRNSLPDMDNLKPVGPVPFSSMPQRYQEMDILVMPTIREGFGLSVAEAMACALPVVASHCSAIPELIDHEKGGILCAVGDVDGFSHNINMLADSPQRRMEMGEYNRWKIESRFTLKRMIEEYLTLFNEILDSSTPRKCQ